MWICTADNNIIHQHCDLVHCFDALRLMRPDEWKTTYPVPEKASADITLHRLQRFTVVPCPMFCCAFGTQQFTVAADECGLVILSQLPLTREAQILCIYPLSK